MIKFFTRVGRTMGLWPPREVRRLLALLALGGGGGAMTAFAVTLVPLVAERSINDPMPLAYALYGALGEILVVLFFFGWSIVKAMVTISAGNTTISASGGANDGEELTPPVVQMTTTTTTAVAAPGGAEITETIDVHEPEPVATVKAS